MATWNIKCQTCRKSGCLGYGVCFACNEPQCNYEPQPTSTTTSTNNGEVIITLSNTTTDKIKE